MDAPATFERDDAKAVSNLAEHGISFLTAIAVFADPQAIMVDTARALDGESRCKTIGRIGNKLFTVVYVMRGDICRLIRNPSDPFGVRI